ncbi:MAG: hypothetical protein M3P06_15235 [Acidobacteriota bacterium]|nr:hypothetical protein [Acidobacteriota bacterium]
MIEGFAPNALVIVNLISPKEKFFGVLRALSPAGVTMQAMNLIRSMTGSIRSHAPRRRRSRW